MDRQINVKSEEELLREEALDWWRNADIDKWQIQQENPKYANTGIPGIVEMYKLWIIKNPK